MPDLSRTLSPQQLWALVAYLESQGGTVDVSASDIPAQTSGGGAAPAGGGGGGGSHGIASGSTDPMELFRAGGCVGCHKIGSEGGAIGPDLTHIGARQSAAQIRESILNPDAKIAKGYQQFAGIMPKTFGDQLTATQLEALVRFFASHK